MIYLIGGSPKCGKTTLAKKMSKALAIPWVSTDTLQCIIMPYIDQNTHSELFPSNFQRCEANDEKYSKYSTEEIIEAYKKQSRTVYEAIRMFVICEIADGNDHIIEGYHIEPELVQELSLRFPDKIKSVFLFRSDEDKFILDIRKSTTPNDWIIARTRNDETFKKIAEMVCRYGDFFESQAQKYGFRAVNMDDDFNDKINGIIDHFSQNID